MVAQHGGYGMYSIRRERQNLEVKLQKISADVALEICKKLKAIWVKTGLDKSDLQTISWVDRLIGRFTVKAQST